MATEDDRIRRGWEQVKEGARTVNDAVKDHGPKQIARAAQTSPVGVGLIAFGGGLLAAALIPETDLERRAAQQVADNLGPVIEPVVEPLQEAGRAVVADVRQSVGAAAADVRDSVGSAIADVRTTAADAATHTAHDAVEGGRSVTNRVLGT